MTANLLAVSSALAAAATAAAATRPFNDALTTSSKPTAARRHGLQFFKCVESSGPLLPTVD